MPSEAQDVNEPARTSLDKRKIKVLLLEGVHDNAIAQFEQAGYTNVATANAALDAEELAAAVKGVHLLGIRSRTQISPAVLDAAKRLIGIGCFCIGTNQVDSAAAAERGVPVFNAPFSNTRSVAELVLAEAILLLRGVMPKHTGLMQGAWRKSADGAFEIRGKTLGIIGYGNIGAQLGVLAEALGMQVVFHDIVAKLPLGNARQLESLDALLATADVVSAHVPATEATENLLDATALAKMRESAVVINASRGHVVDLDALADALTSRRLLGAAIDVYPVEPKSADEVFVSPLTQCENVILTPHIGGSTLEAQANIGIEVADKLIRFSDNGSTLSAVNFPEVQLPEQAGKHRLLHIHSNVPGVLGAINTVFSDNRINVAAQVLQTTRAIGYVVVDLDAEHSTQALHALQQVPGTIKTRVLF